MSYCLSICQLSSLLMKSCGIRASINRMFVASSEMLKYFLISDSGWGRQLQCRPPPLHHLCLGPRQQAEEGARHEAHKEDVDSLWVWSGVSWLSIIERGLRKRARPRTSGGGAACAWLWCASCLVSTPSCSLRQVWPGW